MYPYHGPHHYSHHPHHFDTEDVSVGAMAIGLIVIIGLLVAAVVFLPKPNYAGTGNYFDITATVTGHTDESVLVDEVQVNEAEGEATDWFSTSGGWFGANHLELQNNYSKSWNKHVVGTIYDSHGDVIDVHDVQPGWTVHVTGSIRATQDGKSTQDRAVFDTMRVTSGS